MSYVMPMAFSISYTLFPTSQHHIDSFSIVSGVSMSLGRPKHKMSLVFVKSQWNSEKTLFHHWNLWLHYWNLSFFTETLFLYQFSVHPFGSSISCYFFLVLFFLKSLFFKLQYSLLLEPGYFIPYILCGLFDVMCRIYLSVTK